MIACNNFYHVLFIFLEKSNIFAMMNHIRVTSFRIGTLHRSLSDPTWSVSSFKRHCALDLYLSLSPGSDDSFLYRAAFLGNHRLQKANRPAIRQAEHITSTSLRPTSENRCKVSDSFDLGRCNETSSNL